jgi:hypothetical protein
VWQEAALGLAKDLMYIYWSINTEWMICVGREDMEEGKSTGLASVSSGLGVLTPDTATGTWETAGAGDDWDDAPKMRVRAIPLTLVETMLNFRVHFGTRQVWQASQRANAAGVRLYDRLSKVGDTVIGVEMAAEEFEQVWMGVAPPCTLAFTRDMLGQCGIGWSLTNFRQAKKVCGEAASLGVQADQTLVKVNGERCAQQSKWDHERIATVSRPCTLRFARTHVPRLRIFDFAGQREYYLTHHMFLTSNGLYVVAFDIRKFRAHHFQSMVMFFVHKLQSRVPAAVILLVGTHADMVSEDVAAQRCGQVLALLKAKQERESRRLQSHILQLQRQVAAPLAAASGSADRVERLHLQEARQESEKRIQQLQQQLGRFVKLPSEVLAVSSGESLANIPALREAIAATVTDKRLFPRLGERIPRMYDQARALIHEWRGDLPYCDLETLVTKICAALHLTGEQARERVMGALDFLRDLGEIAHFRDNHELSQLVFLSLQWLVDVNKLVIRHDHSDALVYDKNMKEMTPKTFEVAKANFLRCGRLSIALLRWLWHELRLSEATFLRLVSMLRQFEVAIPVQPQALTQAENGSDASRVTEPPPDSLLLSPSEPGMYLLVPAFFPEYLAAKLVSIFFMPGLLPKGKLQVWRWFDFTESWPAGLMQRLQVLLHAQWPEGRHQVAKEGMVLGANGGCQVLVKLVSAGDGVGEHDGMQMIARGPAGESGAGSAELWRTVGLVVAQIAKLLAQWPGIMVEQFVQWQNSHGALVDILLTKLLQARRAGDDSVAIKDFRGNSKEYTGLDVDGLDATGHANDEVPLERLLGPVDGATLQMETEEMEQLQRQDAQGMEQEQVLLALEQQQQVEEEEQQQQEEGAEEREDGGAAVKALRNTSPEGQVDAEGGEDAEGGVNTDSNYRQLTELLRQHCIPWVMLSYCWGAYDAATDTYETQDMVVRIYKELVRRGIPVWMDIMGGMRANVNEAMGEAVEGAKVVLTVLTEEYQKSYNCNKEINYADSKRKPILPVMAQRGYTPSGSVGVITAGLLWTMITPDMDEEKMRAAVDGLVQGLEMKGVERFPREFLMVGLLDEGKTQEQQRQLDEAQEQRQRLDGQAAGNGGTGTKEELVPEEGHVRHNELGDSGEEMSVEQWFLALKMKPTDAAKYAEALVELGVDVVEHMYALDTEDLEEIGMKKIHRRIVMKKISTGQPSFL